MQQKAPLLSRGCGSRGFDFLPQDSSKCSGYCKIIAVSEISSRKSGVGINWSSIFSSDSDLQL